MPKTRRTSARLAARQSARQAHAVQRGEVEPSSSRTARTRALSQPTVTSRASRRPMPESDDVDLPPHSHHPCTPQACPPQQRVIDSPIPGSPDSDRTLTASPDSDRTVTPPPRAPPHSLALQRAVAQSSMIQEPESSLDCEMTPVEELKPMAIPLAAITAEIHTFMGTYRNQVLDLKAFAYQIHAELLRYEPGCAGRPTQTRLGPVHLIPLDDIYERLLGAGNIGHWLVVLRNSMNEFSEQYQSDKPVFSYWANAIEPGAPHRAEAIRVHLPDMEDDIADLELRFDELRWRWWLTFYPEDVFNGTYFQVDHEGYQYRADHEGYQYQVADEGHQYQVADEGHQHQVDDEGNQNQVDDYEGYY